MNISTIIYRTAKFLQLDLILRLFASTGTIKSTINICENDRHDFETIAQYASFEILTNEGTTITTPTLVAENTSNYVVGESYDGGSVALGLTCVISTQENADYSINEFSTVLEMISELLNSISLAVDYLKRFYDFETESEDFALNDEIDFDTNITQNIVTFAVIKEYYYLNKMFSEAEQTEQIVLENINNKRFKTNNGYIKKERW